MFRRIAVPRWELKVTERVREAYRTFRLSRHILGGIGL